MFGLPGAIWAITMALRLGFNTHYNDFMGPNITSPDGRKVNSSAEYWTGIVGVKFKEDISLQIPPTALDLDLDKSTNTTVSGHWKLPGGILAHPEQVGLIPSPDDPPGNAGSFTISTGFIGVREEMDPLSRQGTGRFGFNCWLCHAGLDDRGQVLLGRPNTAINLGLIMASSHVMDPDHVIRWTRHSPPISPRELRLRENLDETFDFDPDRDGRVTIREWRTAMRMPPVEITQAMLMLAGPGRLDQSIDHRMDGLIPLANLQQHQKRRQGADAHLRTARQPKLSVFNPVSIPMANSGLGVAHFSWSAKDSSMRHDVVSILTHQLAMTPVQLADAIGLPLVDGHMDPERLSRAITLDFRNIGTWGLETDTTSAMAWPGLLINGATKENLDQVPSLFRTMELRKLLTGPDLRTEFASDDLLIAQGREIFTRRVTGHILNQRVVTGREAKTPDPYKGIAAIVPLDRSRSLNELVPVRCATCHNYSPLTHKQKVKIPIDEFQRCDICHLDHPSNDPSESFLSLHEHMRRRGQVSVEDCLTCHGEHPDFGPQVYSNSWLLPFDADGDGQTRGDEAEDQSSGGIGTDASLNVESLFSMQLQPLLSRPPKSYLLSDNYTAIPTQPRFSQQGYGWVRVAPLISVAYSAPFLHNGSVPALNDLLNVPSQRPARFSVGHPTQHFIFDASLPGNRNSGHVFGTELTVQEKNALIRFLNSLP